MLRRGRILLGAFPEPESAVEFVERVSTLPSDIARKAWAAARAAFMSAPPISTQLPVALNAEDHHFLEKVLQAPLFAHALSGKKWRLATMSLEAVVVTQPLVDLERVDVLATRVASDPLATLFPTSTALDVATRTNSGPAISFLSSRGELTISDASMRRLPDNGALELILRIEPRPNYVSVLESQGQLILRNGHHRLIAAWGAGMRSVPCVIVHDTIEALTVRMRHALPTSVLIGPRPPLLSHLAEGSLMTLDVDLRPEQHALRVTTDRQVQYGS